MFPYFSIQIVKIEDNSNFLISFSMIISWNNWSSIISKRSIMWKYLLAKMKSPRNLLEIEGFLASKLVAGVGFEPTTFGLWVCRSLYQTMVLHSNQNYCVNGGNPVLCVESCLVLTRCDQSVSYLLAIFWLWFERDSKLFRATEWTKWTLVS